MPVYDYKCEKGHRFEVVQCGAKAERVLHAPAIHFKGSGFHNTDYGTKKRPVGGDSSGGGEKKSSGTDAAPASAPSSGGESKSSGKTVGLDKA